MRDQGAIVRQLGIDPKKFAENQIADEGGIENAQEPLNENTPCDSIYTPPTLPKNNIAQDYANILTEIFNNKQQTVFDNEYDRAIQQFQPGGSVKYGSAEAFSFWNKIFSAFPNAKLNIEHLSFVQDQNQPPKAAVRWTLIGKHDGNGYFGSPTGANIYILGINHVEFGPRGIKNEWVLFDETMIWKQILMQTG